METIVRIIRTILISLITALCGTLSVLFGWNKRAYYVISRFIWAPGLLRVGGIRIHKSKFPIGELPPCIFYSNHRSHFDIPVLMYSVPRPLYFLAKKELKSIPFLGWGMMGIGMVFIDRKDRNAAIKSMKKAGDQIKRGKSIVTFPEGTRSVNKELLTLKKGTFHLAKSQGIPMVPIAISGSEKVLPKNGKLRSGVIQVKMGKPILENTIEKMSVEELRDEARNRLEDLIAELETK